MFDDRVAAERCLLLAEAGIAKPPLTPRAAPMAWVGQWFRCGNEDPGAVGLLQTNRSTSLRWIGHLRKAVKERPVVPKPTPSAEDRFLALSPVQRTDLDG